MLEILLSFLVSWELFYCSFRIVILAVCFFQSTEMIRGRFPLLHRLLQALPCLPRTRTSTFNYYSAFWCYSWSPTAARDFSPIPLTSCGQVCRSPNLLLCSPCSQLSCLHLSCRFPCKAEGLWKKKQKTKTHKQTSEVSSSCQQLCASLPLPGHKCHSHLTASISCIPF